MAENSETAKQRSERMKSDASSVKYAVFVDSVGQHFFPTLEFKVCPVTQQRGYSFLSTALIHLYFNFLGVHKLPRNAHSNMHLAISPVSYLFQGHSVCRCPRNVQIPEGDSLVTKQSA